MFCSKCGKENSDTSNFCIYCGNNLAVPDNSRTGIESVTVENEASELPVNTKIEEHDEKSEERFRYKAGEFAYAECVQVNQETGSCRFLCIDKRTHFWLNKNIVDEYVPGTSKGKKIWVELTEATDTQKKSWKVKLYKNTNVGFELFKFYEHHKAGDIIHAPIHSCDEESVMVSLGPTATAIIKRNHIPEGVSKASLKPGRIQAFKIVKLEKKDNKVFVVLHLLYDEFALDRKLWAELPESLKNNQEVTFSKNYFSIVASDNELCKLLFSEETPSLSKLIDILEDVYIKEYQQKRICVQYINSEETYYMDISLGIRNSKGVPISACFKKRDGMTWTLCLIGFSNADIIFEHDVYIPSWGNMLQELADMALGNEEWSYSNSNGGKYRILKQYLRFNYYKSWLDGIIVEENGDAIFNTGLVDSSYDDIYCYLRANTNTDDFYERKWEFGYFACRGKGANGKTLNNLFAKFPAAPSYIDMENISNLYFNPTKDLFCDYEHIIGDNLHRLPIDFLYSRLSYDEEVRKLIDEYKKTSSNASYAKIRGIITSGDDRSGRLCRDLQNGLKDAVETAKKYCKWNYKTAIPIYYPRNNAISLLLPLSLQTNHPAQIDVALVIERLPNGNYQGQTILTLEMAYQDARQICRPNSEWLTINNVKKCTDNKNK